MIKKIIAAIAALTVSLSFAGCRNESKYVDQGEKRQVDEQTASDNVSTPDDEDVPPVIDELKTGTYEGTATETKDGKTRELNCKLEISNKLDFKLMYTDKESDDYWGYMFFYDDLSLYKVSSEYPDGYKTAADLSHFSCINDQLLELFTSCGLYEQNIMVSEDGTKLKVDFNNGHLTEWIYAVLEACSGNYDTLYKYTKDDKKFIEWADDYLDNRYDLSEGLSTTAFNELIDRLAVEASDKYLVDATENNVYTIIIDSSEGTLSFEHDTQAIESEEITYSITGELKKTEDIPEDFILPEKNYSDTKNVDFDDDTPDVSSNEADSSDVSSEDCKDGSSSDESSDTDSDNGSDSSNKDSSIPDWQKDPFFD